MHNELDVLNLKVADQNYCLWLFAMAHLIHVKGYCRRFHINVPWGSEWASNREFIYIIMSSAQNQLTRSTTEIWHSISNYHLQVLQVSLSPTHNPNPNLTKWRAAEELHNYSPHSMTNNIPPWTAWMLSIWCSRHHEIDVLHIDSPLTTQDSIFTKY